MTDTDTRATADAMREQWVDDAAADLSRAAIACDPRFRRYGAGDALLDELLRAKRWFDRLDPGADDWWLDPVDMEEPGRFDWRETQGLLLRAAGVLRDGGTVADARDLLWSALDICAPRQRAP